MEKIVNGKNGLVCAFCGKTKDKVEFIIGASSKPDWCMVEGTGKMACPDCYEKASQEGQKRIEKHIQEWNMHFTPGKWPEFRRANA